MNKENKEVRFKGGILIIGSLMWDDSQIRKKWKNQNLNRSEKVLINLPIRYGRISQSRNCTYSMIFSSECKSNDKIGKGYFVPFKEELTIEQIIEQGKFMIDAEHNRVTDLSRFNWGWGCLGIIINPNISEGKSNILKSEWIKKYGNGFNPNQYKIGQEEPIVSKEGILKLEWQNGLKEFEFIVGTVTKPNVEEYPNAREIAIRMVVNKYDEYFKKNRDISITTFQDEEIEVELNKLIEEL